MDIWQEFFEEQDFATYFLGNLTYALLILSMMMRNMVWLRTLAVSSAIVEIYYRIFYVFDPIAIAWETAFVAVNLAQLALLSIEKRRTQFTPKEKLVLDRAFPNLPVPDAKRVLGIGSWREVPDQTVLTREGNPVHELIVIAEGHVAITREGETVARCGPGDFIGEMSFISGRDANATTHADGPVELFALARPQLDALLEKHDDLRRAIESGLNRNLVDKLDKATTSAPTA